MKHRLEPTSKNHKSKKKVKVFEEPSDPDETAQVINFSKPLKSHRRSLASDNLSDVTESDDSESDGESTPWELK